MICLPFMGAIIYFIKYITRACTGAEFGYTVTALQKKQGTGLTAQPGFKRRSSRAPFTGQRLFNFSTLRARFYFMAEPCGGTRKGAPVPSAGL
jgi:hypothetical protein